MHQSCCCRHSLPIYMLHRRQSPSGVPRLMAKCGFTMRILSGGDRLKLVRHLEHVAICVNGHLAKTNPSIPFHTKYQANVIRIHTKVIESQLRNASGLGSSCASRACRSTIWAFTIQKDWKEIQSSTSTDKTKSLTIRQAALRAAHRLFGRKR